MQEVLRVSFLGFRNCIQKLNFIVFDFFIYWFEEFRRVLVYFFFRGLVDWNFGLSLFLGVRRFQYFLAILIWFLSQVSCDDGWQRVQMYFVLFFWVVIVFRGLIKLSFCFWVVEVGVFGIFSFYILFFYQLSLDSLYNVGILCLIFLMKVEY